MMVVGTRGFSVCNTLIGTNKNRSENRSQQRLSFGCGLNICARVHAWITLVWCILELFYNFMYCISWNMTFYTFLQDLRLNPNADTVFKYYQTLITHFEHTYTLWKHLSSQTGHGLRKANASWFKTTEYNIFTLIQIWSWTDQMQQLQQQLQ